MLLQKRLKRCRTGFSGFFSIRKGLEEFVIILLGLAQLHALNLVVLRSQRFVRFELLQVLKRKALYIVLQLEVLLASENF